MLHQLWCGESAAERPNVVFHIVVQHAGGFQPTLRVEPLVEESSSHVARRGLAIALRRRQYGRQEPAKAGRQEPAKAVLKELWPGESDSLLDGAQEFPPPGQLTGGPSIVGKVHGLLVWQMKDDVAVSALGDDAGTDVAPDFRTVGSPLQLAIKPDRIYRADVESHGQIGWRYPGQKGGN